jgi:NAD(P)-dependent dehydrogenase (short-subunit alcohol dehydrogenase family)
MNVIITGASRGIGLELTRKFLAGGNRIITLSRNTEPLEKLNAGNALRYISFDLLQAEKNAALIALVEEHFSQKVDIVINNAGSLIRKPFSQYLPEDFDHMFSVNVKAVFLLIQSLLPYFNSPSHIVNITSMGGFQGSEKFPELALYAASKGALSTLSECLAVELKPQNISVNALAIGAVDTIMLKEAFPGYKASVSAADMAEYIKDFAINGHKVYNGKILPVSLSTP